MLVYLAQLVFGTCFLYFGAEWLVKGSSGLALALGIRPLLVGLTVVAYGTSAPEVTVGIAAALEGRGAIALGNVIGSNIANLGFILGLTAVISPPRADGALIRREIPILLGTTAILPLVLLDGVAGRLEGALLCAVAVGYTAWMIRGARRSAQAGSPAPAEAAAENLEEEAVKGAAEMETDAEVAGAPRTRRKLFLALLAAIGLAVLIFGGKLFVDGAVGLALAAGMSERLVGLTIVAIGTSLPELATSVIAALRGHSSIAVGNVVGSNIFNVLVVLGAGALARPLTGRLEGMALDLGFLGVLTALSAIIMRTERLIRRVEGIALLFIYIAFLLALILVR